MSVDCAVSPALLDGVLNAKPEWTGPLDLWSNLAHLKTSTQHFRTAHDFRVIAVALCTDSLSSDNMARWNQLLRGTNPLTGAPASLERTDPATIDREWALLGYDVADDGLVSGLSNCGFDSNVDLSNLNDFVRSLNTHHLFDSETAANSYRELTDQRVPEHAPFFVYAIYSIEG